MAACTNLKAPAWDRRRTLSWAAVGMACVAAGLGGCAHSNSKVSLEARRVTAEALSANRDVAHLYLAVGAPILVSTGRNAWKGVVPIHSRLLTSTVQVPVSVLSDGQRVVVEGLDPGRLIRQLVRADRTPGISASDAWLRSAPPKFTPLKTTVGACFTTPVMRVTTRLTDEGRPVPGSGSALVFANGAYQTRYRQDPAMDAARPGDNVTLCVAARDSSCGPAAVRGNTYDAYDHRTQDIWRAPDSEHGCSGA